MISRFCHLFFAYIVSALLVLTVIHYGYGYDSDFQEPATPFTFNELLKIVTETEFPFTDELIITQGAIAGGANQFADNIYNGIDRLPAFLRNILRPLFFFTFDLFGIKLFVGAVNSLTIILSVFSYLIKWAYIITKITLRL